MNPSSQHFQPHDALLLSCFLACKLTPHQQGALRPRSIRANRRAKRFSGRNSWQSAVYHRPASNTPSSHGENFTSGQWGQQVIFIYPSTHWFAHSLLWQFSSVYGEFMIGSPLGSGLWGLSTLCIAQGQHGRAERPLKQDPGTLVLVLTLPFTVRILNCNYL